MNWKFGQTRKPHDDWERNRQSGYDWDEESSEDFSYDDVGDEGEFEEPSSEPEYLELDPAGEEEGEVQYESLGVQEDSVYAREPEYRAEHQVTVTGTEYAAEPEYEAEHIDYAPSQEYAAEPGLDFEQDDRDLDFAGSMGQVKPVQVGGSVRADYARDARTAPDVDSTYEEDDGGYLPELSEEDTHYGIGGGLVGSYGAQPEYGIGDGFVQPLLSDPDYGLDMGQSGGAGGGFVDDQEDAWAGDEGEDSFLNDGQAPEEEGYYGQTGLSDDERENEFLQQQRMFEEEAPAVSGGVTAQDDDGFDGEIQYIEEDEEEEWPVRPERQERPAPRPAKRQKKGGALGMFEGIIAVAGVVVILALIGFIGVLVWSGKNKNTDPYSQFAGVGTQLSGIDLIGGKGITAVANARIEKLTPELDPLEETDDEPQSNSPDYNENDYKTTVKVSMTLISVQKDLKIKFINKENSKLIGNVRFVAEVTRPDGTVVEWVDSDMDGIIYEEDIDAGKYSVTLKELDEEKYSNYIMPASAQTVNVKKNIEYVKVDVSGEAKKDTETSTTKEDTRINETTNESSLNDTVSWVSSTVTGNTYTEVLKSTVPDPLTLPIQVAKSFRRVAALAGVLGTPTEPTDGEGGEGGEGGGDPTPTAAPTAEPTAAPTAEPTVAPTAEPTVAPTAEPTAAPTAEPTAAPTATPTAAPTAAPSATPTAAPSATPTAAPSATPTANPSATPTANPSATPSASPSALPSGSPSASPSADPTGVPSMELDAEKVELLVTKSTDGSSSTAETATVKATVKGYLTGKELDFNAESANKAIATAAIDANGKLTIIAVAKGTTKITVTVDYKNAEDRPAGVTTKVTKTIDVTVTEKEALTLTFDKTEILCYSEVTDKPVTLLVTVKNSNKKAAELVESKMTFSAESSDTTVVKIAKKEFLTSTVDGTVQVRLTLEPQVLLEKKSAFLQVKYTEGDEDVTAKCAVTVKPHPRNDKVTPLLDKDGVQLFVADSNNTYRQAVYADYYVDGTKFFIQSGVKYTGWQTLDGKVYYFNAEGKYVTGEQIIQGAKYQFGPDGVLMNGNGVLGIDVSKWNGSINWNAVKNSGVTFVIIRCGFRGSSGGAIYEDSKFAANIKGATDAGLKVGVYFFTQAVSEVEAVYEASYVIDRVKNYKITYPIFLDVEASGGRGDKINKDTRTKVCKAFCQTIQNSGYTAGIYANKTWLNEKINVSELNNYRIWLAQYASQPTYDGRYDIWQYKSTGNINGISGNVDMNLSYMGY